MERFLLNFSLILILIYFYKITRHGLHILQLENYYIDRYAVWMKRYIKKVVNIKVIILLLIPIILFAIGNPLFTNIGFAVQILGLLYLIVTTKKPKEKKPFVVTARIKRVYLTYLILFAIAVVCANIFNYKVVLSIVNICTMFAYTFVYIVSLINKPVEKSIRKGFCKKAQKKLKEIPGLKVIGITGSYGKTSTKYIVNTILSQKYNTLMTPESYNTTMGVVRTINEKLTPMHQLFVCEMGAKYVGDIKEITDIVEPTYGILTAVGPQHLDTFKSLDNVRKTKLELVDSLPDDEGIAFVNWEDENIRNSKITKKMVKYGLTKDADYYAENIDITERGSSFDVVIPGKESIRIKTRLLGSLNILNIVAAVAIADKLGLTPEEIKVGAKYIRPVPHRLELKQNPNGSIIIDDAYNSNNRGAKMALDVLKSFEHKKRILITPGIVELGDKATEINQELGRNAAQSSDFIILVGASQAVPIYNGIKEMNYPESQVFIAKNLQEALSKMNEILTKDSVVLLENDLPDNYL
jgi:UDP-N-acetylmuramoyl-tripeptide--D-alanyl-D-alanine ligase